MFACAYQKKGVDLMSEVEAKKLIKERKISIRLNEDLLAKLMSKLSDNISVNVRQCIEKYLEMSDNGDHLSDNGDQKDVLSDLSNDLVDKLSDSFDEISDFVRQVTGGIRRISNTGLRTISEKIIAKINVVKWRFADRN